MSATAHNFQLVLAGVNELSDDLAEAIFMAFEGDANLSSRGGTVTVDFFESISSVSAATTGPAANAIAASIIIVVCFIRAP